MLKSFIIWQPAVMCTMNSEHLKLLNRDIRCMIWNYKFCE